MDHRKQIELPGSTGRLLRVLLLRFGALLPTQGSGA